MWRKTFLVMFAPSEGWLIEDKPYLPDLQFEADKPKCLGMKISENRYLGFPGIDPEAVDTDAPWEMHTDSYLKYKRQRESMLMNGVTPGELDDD